MRVFSRYEYPLGNQGFNEAFAEYSHISDVSAAIDITRNTMILVTSSVAADTLLRLKLYGIKSLDIQQFERK